MLTERYRQAYNRIRSDSSLCCRPSVPETLMPADPVPLLAGVTAMMYPGNLGPGLTVGVTG